MNEEQRSDSKPIETQAITADDVNSIPDDVACEFAAWEAASDEALLNFEKENL